jgi:hypothetical protein
VNSLEIQNVTIDTVLIAGNKGEEAMTLAAVAPAVVVGLTPEVAADVVVEALKKLPTSVIEDDLKKVRCSNNSKVDSLLGNALTEVVTCPQ